MEFYKEELMNLLNLSSKEVNKILSNKTINKKLIKKIMRRI